MNSGEMLGYPVISYLIQISSPLSWLCPLPSLIHCYSTCSTSSIGLLPILLNISQYLAWSFYGHKSLSPPIMRNGLQGFFVYILYILLILKWQSSTIRTIAIIMLIFIQAMFMQFFNTLAIGYIAASFQILSAFSNIKSIVASLRSRSNVYFNRLSLTVLVPNSIVWVVMALETEDTIILLPNLIDTAINTFMCVLYLYFGMEVKQNKTYMPVSNVTESEQESNVNNVTPEKSKSRKVSQLSC